MSKMRDKFEKIYAVSTIQILVCPPLLRNDKLD